MKLIEIDKCPTGTFFPPCCQVKPQSELLGLFAKETYVLTTRLVPKKFWATLTTLIRSIKYKLIIKLITRMDGKSRDKSIKSN